MTEWQPIETAPKDGTDILIYQPPEKIWGLIFEHVIYVCHFDGRGRWTESDGERYSNFKPTHWMPLPEPPLNG